MNIGNDINTVFKLANMLKILTFLKAALTVGIIAFTVFRVIMTIREN